MSRPSSLPRLLRSIRIWIIGMMIAIILSGVTAFPVESELSWLLRFKDQLPSPLSVWLQQVYTGIRQTNEQYPFLAYGFDWLAFAHIVIALAFIGPFRDPVRNRWVIEWGMICCIGVLPLALIAAPVREIPTFHIWIDCAFGVFGIIPLYFIRKKILLLERLTEEYEARKSQLSTYEIG